MAGLDFGHGGNYGYGEDVIDFSSNINPIVPPAKLKREMFKNWGRVVSYPDPEARDLVKEIANHWKIGKENILTGNGAVELIYLVIFALKPGKVLIFSPTFSEYERASRIVNAKVKFIPLDKNNFKLNFPKNFYPDLTFICNPNNPTGNLVLKDNNLSFKSKFFVIDEAFMDFLPGQKRLTFIPKAVKNKNIVVIRSFTKFFSIPGLRLGYLIAHKDLIKSFRKYQIPWNVNSFAQIAGKVLINDKEYIRRTRELINKERNFLFDEINRVRGLKCFSSVTNFLLVKIKNGHLTSKLIKKLLLDKKILIRDCSNFRNLGNKFFRISVRGRKENRALIQALKGFLNKDDG